MLNAPSIDNAAPSTRPHYATAYSHASEMQAVLMQDILSADTPKALRPRLVEAWDKLEDRKRILRNKPLPGALVHEKVKVGRTRRSLSDIMLRAMPDASDQQPSESSAPSDQPS